MRFPIRTVTAAPMMLAWMFDAAHAQDGALKPPMRHWAGIFEESGKRTLAPKSKVLDNQDAFEKLFDAWGLKEKPPKIDFKKRIVIVQTCDGLNRLWTYYRVDAAGTLTAVNKQTEKGVQGFGYSIDVLDRVGIKSYEGKPLE